MTVGVLEDRPASLPAERVRMPKADRRAAIFDEAITLIGKQGYRGFSINDLAKRCGLTTAGLLHHFGTKDGVLVALLEERDSRDQQAVAGRLGLTRDQSLTCAQVLTALRAIVENNAGQPHLLRAYAILRAEALCQGHPAQDYFYRRDRATLKVFADLVAPHVGNANATALQIHATMAGLELQWLRDDCSFDLVAAWDSAAVKLLRQEGSGDGNLP